MKVLVTGATGNVGKAVVKELVAQGESVLAAGSDPLKIKAMFPQGVSAVAFDFLDKSTFEAALDGVDRVFLMRPPHLGDPQALMPFIDALKRIPIRLVAFLSLMGIEHNPIPPHAKIEKAIRQAGLPYTFIRPGFFMQNVSGIHAEDIRLSDQILIPAGNSQTSFVDAEDVGECAAELLAHAEQYANTTHTITGPQALTYHEVACILSEVTGRTILYPKISLLRYRHHSIVHRKLDPAYVDVTLALYIMTRLGTAKAVTHDFEKLTGHSPKSFKAFALEHREAFGARSAL